ncbi:MAG: hypothetical protein ABI843_16190 [Dokdonella sp.]
MRGVACVLTLALIANAIVVAALPIVPLKEIQTPSADSGAAPCPHHTEAQPAASVDRHHHVDDCLCCIGKLCACGPVCTDVTFVTLPASMPLVQTPIVTSPPPGAYVTVAGRLLRPPIG